MVVKLSRASVAQTAPKSVMPKGWPTKAADGQSDPPTPADEAHAEVKQRSAIAEKLLGRHAPRHTETEPAPAASDMPETKAAGFSAQVQAALATADPNAELPFNDGHTVVVPAPGVAAPRTRKAKTEVTPNSAMDVGLSLISNEIGAVATALTGVADAITNAGSKSQLRHDEAVRSQVLELAFSKAFEPSTLEEGFDVANALLAYVKNKEAAHE